VLTFLAFVIVIITGNTTPTHLKLLKIKVFNIRQAIDDLFDLIDLASWADHEAFHTLKAIHPY